MRIQPIDSRLQAGKRKLLDCCADPVQLPVEGDGRGIEPALADRRQQRRRVEGVKPDLRIDPGVDDVAQDRPQPQQPAHTRDQRSVADARLDFVRERPARKPRHYGENATE